MNLKAYGEIVVTHVNPRTGDTIEDQRQQVSLCVDISQLSDLLQQMVEDLVMANLQTFIQNGHIQGNGQLIQNAKILNCQKDKHNSLAEEQLVRLAERQRRQPSDGSHPAG